jgi:hypothetical protein
MMRIEKVSHPLRGRYPSELRDPREQDDAEARLPLLAYVI